MILVFKLGIMLGVAGIIAFFAMVFDTLHVDAINELQYGPWFSQERYEEEVKNSRDVRQLSMQFYAIVIVVLEVIIWLKL